MKRIAGQEPKQIEPPLPEGEQVALQEKYSESLSHCRSLERKLARLERDNKALRVMYENSERIRDFNEAEKELQYLFNRLLLETCPDLIIVFDKNLEYVIGTSAGALSLGYKDSSSLTGVPFTDIFARKVTKEWIDSSLQKCESVLSSLQSLHYSDKVTYLDNTDAYVHITLSPAVDATGNCLGLVFLLHDITELTLTKEKAEAAASARAIFLANMSHEIRTPMNAIKGMSELLFASKLDSIQKSYAANVVSATESLLRIINDILDFSKIESNKLELINSDYRLSSLIYDVCNITQIKTEQKNLYLSVIVDPDIPDNLIGDSVRIKQVLINILNNAIKFTDKGHIRLSIKMRKENERVRLLFTISDTGIGIKEEHLLTIFNDFEQADMLTNRKVEGTGLGLAISKRLVKMMQGEICVSSQYGSGSTFTFDILQSVMSEGPIARINERESKNVLVFVRKVVPLDYLHETLNMLQLSYDLCFDQEELEYYIENKKYTHVFLVRENVEQICAKYKDRLVGTKVSVIANMSDALGEVTLPNVSVLVRPLTVFNLAKTINGENVKNNLYIEKAQGETLGSVKTKGVTALLADDNSINLIVGMTMLEEYGISVDTAEDGNQAIEKIKQKKYDIVFMDHMMPNVDGLEATKLIRKMGGQFLDLPIIALTANALTDTREMLLDGGMNDFISKPIEIRDLNLVLKKWLPPSSIVIPED